MVRRYTVNITRISISISLTDNKIYFKELNLHKIKNENQFSKVLCGAKIIIKEVSLFEDNECRNQKNKYSLY
jgi:hypothetical protein